MDKRAFLKLLAGSTATCVAAAGQAASRVTPAYSTHPLLLQKSPLAGFQFYEGRKLWKALDTGDLLTLRREAQNPYDARAVAVLWNSRQLGYLPRDENAAVSQLLDRGEKLQARIAALRVTQNPWERMELAVEWCP